MSSSMDDILVIGLGAPADWEAIPSIHRTCAKSRAGR